VAIRVEAKGIPLEAGNRLVPKRRVERDQKRETR
jgi:hypothetical protein